MAQRAILIAQAEVRETRTRRRTTRPDYAYLNDPEEDVRRYHFRSFALFFLTAARRLG